MRTVSEGNPKDDQHARTRDDRGWGSLTRSLMTTALAVCLFAVACSTSGEGGSPIAPEPTDSRSTVGGKASHGDWVTFHADVTRSGIAAGVGIDEMRTAWTSQALDADIYAEPLIIDSLVIVVTENDSIYALDRSDGRVVWRTNVGAPVASSTLPCGNISPLSGITATPVADPASHLIYVVAFLSPGHHEIFAVSYTTGHVAWHRTMDPPGMDPLRRPCRTGSSTRRGSRPTAGS